MARRSKQDKSKDDPIIEPDDPRLPPYSRLTNPRFLTPEWRERHGRAQEASVAWSEWKRSQRKDQSIAPAEEQPDFELISPPIASEQKRRLHAKDLRNTGNMA